MVNLYWTDLAWGPAIGCLLAAVATRRPAPLVAVLDSRPVRTLGSFSYSLYLTHAPLVAVLCFDVVNPHVAQGVPSFLVSVALGIPLTVLFAWGFGSLFEIPFQRYRGWNALVARFRPSYVEQPAPVDR
jgi:peptidoglycan/LPS O-acetylase OafA/YrhL